MRDIKSYRQRSCELVSLLAVSDELFLERTLELWSLGNKIYTEAWNTEFHVFGVIASETDHLPLGSVREKCSSRFLWRADEELKEVIKCHKADLQKAYNEILVAHGDA